LFELLFIARLLMFPFMFMFMLFALLLLPLLVDLSHSPSRRPPRFLCCDFLLPLLVPPLAPELLFFPPLPPSFFSKEADETILLLLEPLEFLPSLVLFPLAPGAFERKPPAVAPPSSASLSLSSLASSPCMAAFARFCLTTVSNVRRAAAMHPA